jgi:thiosulfate/3-mercaptopyruvate sulfurtransferase
MAKDYQAGKGESPMTAEIAIVTPGEVRERLNNVSPYIILDARPHSHYVAGHIPGAIWINWESWCEEAPAHAGQTLAQAGYWGVLKESTDVSLQEAVTRSGLRDGCPALVYADGPNSRGREARIAWMLLYWGVSSVSLLNGGWSAWLKMGGSSDVVTPTPGRGQFHIRVQGHRRVQLQQLKQDLQGNTTPLLIDARSRSEFAGRDNSYQPRLGRLPGAVHIPFTDLFDETGRYVTKSAYLERLPPQVRNADRCAAYCEVGVRSCLFALLHEIYTGQVVANFDGSVMQWALDKTLPMERDYMSGGSQEARDPSLRSG